MIAPDRRILQLSAGARMAVQRVSESERVLTAVQNGRAMHYTLTQVECAGFGTLMLGAAGDPPPFGGYGQLPLQAAQ